MPGKPSVFSVNNQQRRRNSPAPYVFMAILLQPFSMNPVIGTVCFHLSPKCRRMVHFLPVAQLVNHHIVHNFLRTQHQKAIEIQISLCAAAAPTGTLAADGDAAIGYTQLLCKPANLFGQYFRHLFRQCFPFSSGQDQHFRSRRNGLQILPDPSLLAGYKGIDLPFAAPPGATDLHFPGGLDHNGNGLPAGANQGIGNLHQISTPLQWSTSC